MATTIDLASSLGTKGFAINGAATDDQSGYSVSSAGDINNDGCDDIIIGALYADPSLRANTRDVFGTTSNLFLD